MAKQLGRVSNFLINEYIKLSGSPGQSDNRGDNASEFLRFAKSRGYELYHRNDITKQDR